MTQFTIKEVKDKIAATKGDEQDFWQSMLIDMYYEAQELGQFPIDVMNQDQGYVRHG